MKIVIFTDTFYPEINGVTSTLNRLLTYFEKKQITYFVFAPNYEKEDCRETNVIYFKGIAPFLSPNSRIAIPSHAIVREKILEFRPDLIHVVTEFTLGFLGMKIAKECQIPLLMSYHTNIDQYVNYYKMSYMKKPVEAYFRYFHNQARLNLCPSIHTMWQLEQLGFKNLALWSRGVDTQQFSPNKRNFLYRRAVGGEERFLFLYVGRIVAEKGLDVLADSIEILEKSHPGKFTFIFTGDGPYREELEKRQLESVVFTGFLEGEPLAQIYASCDSFVFPSGTETFGNVVLEAMASGLPVVCTDSGGVTDFAYPDQNACVVQNQNVKSLTEGMLKVYKDAAYRKKISEQALHTAQKRSWETIFERLLISYDEAVRHEKGQPVTLLQSIFGS